MSSLVLPVNLINRVRIKQAFVEYFCVYTGWLKFDPHHWDLGNGKIQRVGWAKAKLRNMMLKKIRFDIWKIPNTFGDIRKNPKFNFFSDVI